MTKRIKVKYFGRTSMRDFGGPQAKKVNRTRKHRSLAIVR